MADRRKVPGATIVGPTAMFLPALPDGSANPLFNLVLFAVTRQRSVVDKPDGTSYINGINNFGMFTSEIAQQLIAAGLDIQSWPARLVIEADKVDDEVPEFLQPPAPEDEEEEAVRLTWSTVSVSTIDELDSEENPTGRKVIACSSGPDYWLASVAFQCAEVEGVTLLPPT